MNFRPQRRDATIPEAGHPLELPLVGELESLEAVHLLVDEAGGRAFLYDRAVERRVSIALGQEPLQQPDRARAHVLVEQRSQARSYVRKGAQRALPSPGDVAQISTQLAQALRGAAIGLDAMVRLPSRFEEIRDALEIRCRLRVTSAERASEGAGPGRPSPARRPTRATRQG
ncbi:MAG: hypothetical protein RIF41_39880 [Polyangiaceae bacterium]